jgi:hypothetical protein
MQSKQISLLAAFAEARVEYAVVGGIAVNAHGYLRTTRDLDVFIRPSEDNAKAVHAALESIGAPLEGIQPSDLLDDEAHFRFGSETNSIDILASIGEMPFDQVWRNRVEATIDGIPVTFISKPDLIANKSQTGRHIDLADVEGLLLIPEREISVAAFSSVFSHSLTLELTGSQILHLLSTQYFGSLDRQLQALAGLSAGTGELAVMEGRILLGYTHANKSFIARLDRADKPALDAKLAELATHKARSAGSEPL